MPNFGTHMGDVLICIAVLLFSSAKVQGQADSVDSFIMRNMESHRIPGVSLAVIRNGTIIKSGGYGMANLELSAPASTKTVYELGSLTKQFTSMSIMMLVEEGKLSLNDRITRFFPAAPPAWANITIRHLLTHTSGIQNHVAVPGYLGVFKINLFRQSFPDSNEIQHLFFQLPLEFEPGQTWAYDNTGYYLLGLIIEKLSRLSYWSFLKQRIFEPLGMKDTRSTDVNDIVFNRASGYTWLDGGYKNQSVLWPFVGFSAGSLMSTVEDLALWDAALYTEKLVKRATLNEMWQAAKSNSGSLLPYNCGFGWFIDTYHNHRIVQHSGGTLGFSSVIYRFPDDSLTVVMLTNHADKMIDQLAIDIAGMYLPALKRPMGIKEPSQASTSRLKSVFSQLLEGAYNPTDFSPAMNIFLKTSTSKSLWQWFGSFGKLGAFQLADYEQKEGVDVFRYRVQLGENSYLFTISVGKNGQIEQIYFS